MSNVPPSHATLSQLVADHIAIEPGQVRRQTCSTGKHNQKWRRLVLFFYLPPSPEDAPTDTRAYSISTSTSLGLRQRRCPPFLLRRLELDEGVVGSPLPGTTRAAVYQRSQLLSHPFNDARGCPR